VSLARTALRLAAVEALNSDPVIAALCDGRVYDSRVTDFDHTERVPVIIVTTDDDQGEAYSANNGGEPFDLTVDLVLEIAMMATAIDDAGDAVGLGSPATDRELEAVLDLLEERAVTILTVPETAAARLVRAVTRRVTRKKSSRFATDETGEKLAIRLTTLSVALKGDDYVTVPTGPFAALPDPLRTVCAAMPAGSSALATCQLLAAAMPVPDTPADAAFKGINLILQPVLELSPNGPPPRAAQAPIGTPEITDNTMNL
jgi:hypothetical protein